MISSSFSISLHAFFNPLYSHPNPPAPRQNSIQSKCTMKILHRVLHPCCAMTCGGGAVVMMMMMMIMMVCVSRHAAVQ